jgi:adenosyl cobinamide kinase/adenosyl cobinamide phosphate guanylyltransferase
VLGRLNRRVASLAEQAYLVVCGYAVDLRTIGRNVEE